MSTLNTPTSEGRTAGAARSAATTARAGRAAARPVKRTDDELAAQAQQDVAGEHAQPRYDLTTEAWIPVLQDGAVRLVGLTELLTQAHRISDVAVPHPLLRAALRRLLLALTADLVQADRDLDEEHWQRAHLDNTGFTPEQVAALLDRHAAHLFLWHPHFPFLQDRRLLITLVKPHADQPIQDLVLDLPSGSSAAWWVKAGDPALRRGQHPADTALWLVARWFYAINGNCGDVRLPGGGTVGSQSGGAFAETVATITHAFRTDSVSLFRSLLRGLPAGIAGQSPGAGCAWLDPQQPRPVDDPLYLATLNPGAVLLTGTTADGLVTRFVRASTPLPSEQAKQLRDTAAHADQHRLTVARADGTPAAVRILPGAHRSHVLQQLHRDGFEGRALRGVVSSADCWLPASSATVNAERLDLLLVRKGGTGSSPVWQELRAADLPARHVDPTHPDPAYAQHVRAAVRTAFDPVDGVRERLAHALRLLFAQPADGGWALPRRDAPAGRTAAALFEAAYDRWQAATAQAFTAALDASPTDEQALPTWQTAVWAAALDAYDEVTRPYLSSSRYAARYAAARRHLTARRPA